MFAPRGPQKPKRLPSGISPWALIHFMEDAKVSCEQNGHKDEAFVFEQLLDFFRNYDIEKPLKYNSRILGL